MRHWSESLVESLACRLGGDPDRDELNDVLRVVGRRIDVLAGRSFSPARLATSTFVNSGLPFVDVPDLRVGTAQFPADAWEIPDPVQPEVSTVVQVASIAVPSAHARRVADAFWIGGMIVAEASREGLLSADYVLHWLKMNFDHDQRIELFRSVMDPGVRFNVPVLNARAEGWWFQITRRLSWITQETPDDDERLAQPLLDDSVDGGQLMPLVATEPVLIMARMTRQPVDWAFSARIWPEEVQVPPERRWAKYAAAVHGHGVPTITVDSASTPAEIACQMVLKGFWHGYIGGDEPTLAKAVAMAYPQPVARVQRGTNAPDPAAAAATLLGQLVRPGFDPSQGAEATRRYVRRKASIVVMEHHKQESPELYPWTQVGISERRFYKLLPQYAVKINGRYEFERDDVVARMTTDLNDRDHARDVRALALDLLRSRGFSEAAARKWLQRHPPQDAVTASPRGARPKPRDSAVLANGLH